MKYIRTKDGRIWEIIESDDETGTFVITNYKESYTLSYHNKNIFKQADTIEELCDVYVVEKLKHIFVIDENSKSVIRYCKERPIYGAIWTDKGLIYVAKLNDKGILELL